MKHFTCDRSNRENTFRYYTTSKLSENMHETPEGYLVCVGVPIARTGEMIYGEGETPLETDDDGQIIITREEKEVFRPETMASFEGKAVTITHPVDFVGPENWSRLSKGVLQNVRRGEGDQKDDLIADMLIMDSMAINLVKNGLREVSCGYEAEYTQTEEGRGTQTNIVGNHLALVEKGRAGSSYAIKDHKGKGVPKMKLSDKIKAIFAKAQDEALKIAEDEAGGDPKKDESKDAYGAAIDELTKMVKDLGSKMDTISGGKDAAGTPPPKKDDAPPAKKEGEDADPATAMEDRLKALEAAVQKLLEGQAQTGDEEDDEDGDETGDDDFEESTMTGDTASRAEILAPGIAKTKDEKSLKVKALRVAYATKDGKKVIEAFTGGKAPTFDSVEKVDMLFIAASEVLKANRTDDLSKTKQTRDFDSENGSRGSKGPMTAEDLNAINEKFYSKKK